MEIKLVILVPDEIRLSKAHKNCFLFRFSFQHVHNLGEHNGCMDMFLFSRSLMLIIFVSLGLQ